MYTPEEQARLTLFRVRAAAGELTQAELAEAVGILRQKRMAAQASAKKARSAKAPSAGADALLAELEGL